MWQEQTPATAILNIPIKLCHGWSLLQLSTDFVPGDKTMWQEQTPATAILNADLTMWQKQSPETAILKLKNLQ